MLFSWSHQATGPAWLDTAVHLWFGRIIRRSLWEPRTMPVRASCGSRTGIFISYGTRMRPVRPVRHPYGHVRELTQPALAEIPHGRDIWSYGARKDPLRCPHGLLMSCLRYLNPYGDHKLMMNASNLYRPRTGRQNSYGAARGPYGSREWTYDFFSKQPGNITGTARAGPGSVMWLRHKWYLLNINTFENAQ